MNIFALVVKKNNDVIIRVNPLFYPLCDTGDTNRALSSVVCKEL